MTTTLFAFCRPNGGAVAKRIIMDADAQKRTKTIFDAQYAAFMDGVDHEVKFDGDWKPEDDEILVCDLPSEAKIMLAAAKANAVAIPSIDAPNFEQESIKGLFLSHGGRTLIQTFTTQQLLLRRAWFAHDGQTFKELSTNAFCIASAITAVIEGSKLKFKSFPAIRRVLDLVEFYKEATDAEIDSFCAHSKLTADADVVKSVANQTVRKRLHAVQKSGVLDDVSVKDFSARAAKLKVPLKVEKGKIAMPADLKGLRDFLSFMENKVYEGVLDNKVYVANAKRPFT